MQYFIFQDDVFTLGRFFTLPHKCFAFRAFIVSLPCCNKRAFQLFFNCRKAKWSVPCSGNLAFLLQNTRGILAERYALQWIIYFPLLGSEAINNFETLFKQKSDLKSNTKKKKELFLLLLNQSSSLIPFYILSTSTAEFIWG